VLNSDGCEQRIEVEPMAGSCYLTVDAADAAYSAEIGFFHPAWNRIASSELISTPPDGIGDSDSEFATVPFHLSFQHMIEMLRSSRPDDPPLVTQLSELRERTRDDSSSATAQERDLAETLDHVDGSLPPQQPVDQSRVASIWSRGRLERILGFGATSPSAGFGGSSRSV
jgi:hypothetical protein